MSIRKLKFLSVVALTSLLLSGCGSKSVTPVVIKPLVLGELIKFNVPQKSILASGWSGTEPWGTWSDGKVANLELGINTSYSKPITIAVESDSFLAKHHDSIQIDILANAERITTWSYTQTSNLAVRNLVISPSVFKGLSGRLELTFVMRSPASPKSLGVSDDVRLLGIGLVSIELTKVG